jgi:hypothetical protein
MSRAPIALVLHANQLIIGDGYADRDGISVIGCGYDAVLSAHLELGIPLALHVSGPLVEALAWHRPDLLARMRAALESGVVRLVGGTYGENIVPRSSPQHNRRQLAAMTEMMPDLLGVDPVTVHTAWLPERVWATEPVVDAFTDPRTTGGGYRRCLVDERLFLPADGDQPYGRAAFDAQGPYAWPVSGWPQHGHGLVDPALLRLRRVVGSPLTLVPISSHLRYLLPPRDPSHLGLVEDIAADIAEHDEPALLVFADDLERVAGVGGWEPAVDRYQHFLRWLAGSCALEAVHLDDWCDAHEPAVDDAVDPAPGTYYELADHYGAKDDYSGWADDARWAGHAARLRTVDAAVQEALARRPASPLVQVADRIAMLGEHELAWQDPAPDGHGRAPAPWVRATAAHTADALPLLAADRWFASGASGLWADLNDIDGDGEDELVLAGSRMFAVLHPRWGARATLVVTRSNEGGLHQIVGNPANHWNFQEETGRWMDQPAGHPGALGLAGSEHHRFAVTRIEMSEHRLIARLVDTEAGPEFAPVVTVVLAEHSDALAVCYSRPGMSGELSVGNAICPDYREALRWGRARTRLQVSDHWVGAHARSAHAWIGVAAGEAVINPPAYGDAGHAVLVNVRASGRHLDLVLGGGDVSDAVVNRHLTGARKAAHEIGAATVLVRS